MAYDLSHTEGAARTMTITADRPAPAPPEPVDHDEILRRLHAAWKLAETRVAACMNANLTQSTEPVHTVVIPESSRHFADSEAVLIAERVARIGRKTNVHLQLWDYAPDENSALGRGGFVSLEVFGGSSLLRQMAAARRGSVTYHRIGGEVLPQVPREPADGRLILVTNRRGVKERVYLRDDASAVDGEYPPGHRWFDIDPNSPADPVTYDSIVDNALRDGSAVHLLAEITLLVAPPPANR